MAKILARFMRALRARRAGWSAESDRVFHDGHFRTPDADPFDFSYPGYITIKRFADLTSPFLEGSRFALDVGCGPGEITCELAARHPGTRFVGIDHSPVGIAKARRNAERRGLSNVEFRVKDVSAYAPDHDIDLVLLFDAFHHLTDPARFIKRMGERTSRFLLIEPRGDWKGAWKRDLDFDWLLHDLEKLRARIDHLLDVENDGEGAGAGDREKDGSGAGPGDDTGAVEFRYTMKDFMGFFSGYGLKFRGTVSGLDSYPPASGTPGPSSGRFGEFAYVQYKQLDDRLFEKGLDLLAKHWVIYAERGAVTERRTIPDALPVDRGGVGIQGSHDVEYRDYRGPIEAAVRSEFTIKLRILNRSFRVWSSSRDRNPDFLSYHWWDRNGKAVIHDGERTPLPGGLEPGRSAEVEIRIVAPAAPGRFILAVDLVQEGVAWFSEDGGPCLQVPFQIRR
jgi:SAM-dependent methyltransferase